GPPAPGGAPRVLRPAVPEGLIASSSGKTGVIGAAFSARGVALPVLTLHQLRMVLRIFAAHGLELDNENHRLPELAATVGAGFGFRTVARGLSNLIPSLGWAVKGGVAYGGTRAIGEATVRYSEARAGLSEPKPPQPASAPASSS